MEIKSDRKEKKGAHRVIFVNNCIVNKVQEFMYKKNTVVLASAPRRETQREQKKGTDSGEESENHSNVQNTVKNAENMTEQC